MDLREGVGFDQLFTGPQPNTMRWHICSNRVAVRTKQDHSIVWTQHAEIGGNKDAKSLKGREGFGHELLKALQPGDRIAILALAEVRELFLTLAFMLTSSSNGVGRITSIAAQ